MKIQIQKPREDLKSNLEKIDFLIKEVELLKDLFFNRINSLIEQENIQQQEFEIQGIPKPEFSYRNFEHNFSDIQMSVYFKCYLFIIRQAIEKIFKVMYQMKKCLGFDNVKSSLPNLSQSGKFGKHFKSLLDNQYDYDNEIIELCQKWSDIFIITRIIRNALKSQASFKVWIINNEEVHIICPLLPRERKDQTISLIKTKMSATGEELKNFVLKPGFVNKGIDMLKEFSDLLNSKYNSNCV